MDKRLRPLHYLALFGGAVLIAAGMGWYLAKRSVDLPRYSPPAAGMETAALQKQVVHLYFGGSQGRFLRAEQRIVEQPEDAVLIGRQIVEALIQGSTEGGGRTLPPDARLRSFFITDDSTAYVDFEAAAFDHHPRGVGTELLSIYSIVNTLVLNVEAIRSVKILLGGQEAATLAGHVDLSHTFKADMLWVR